MGAFHSVSALVYQRFLDFAVQKGAIRPALLSATGVRAEDLKDPDDRIDFERYRQLVIESIASTGLPHLGLLSPHETKLDEANIIGLFGKLVLCAGL